MELREHGFDMRRPISGFNQQSNPENSVNQAQLQFPSSFTLVHLCSHSPMNPIGFKEMWPAVSRVLMFELLTSYSLRGVILSSLGMF